MDIPEVVVMSDRKHRRLDLGSIPTMPGSATPTGNAVPPDLAKADGGSGLLLNLKNKQGQCRVCGAAFMGPGNQKYCQDHSASVRYRGKH
jgi:hypothetical protein